MRVEARSIGPIARLVLRQATMATVAAVFCRSFYLEAGGQLICVTDESAFDGPLNLLIRARGTRSAVSDLGILVGERWAGDGTHLERIDDAAITIDISPASAWKPRPPSPSFPGLRGVIGGIESLKTLAASSAPEDGLLRLVLAGKARPTNATERAASVPLSALRRHAAIWLDDCNPCLVDSLFGLLGLGPGLTPSGDDLIAGLLITCHYLGKGEAASALWHRLEHAAKNLTNPISFAHLAAAGQGLGAAPFHDLIDASIENQLDRMTEALDAVAKIGHCSGFDAVAGLLVLLDAWTAAKPE